MPQVCIVTDNTAQFTQASFPGVELVTMLPLPIHLNGEVYSAGPLPPLFALPHSLPDHSQPLVRTPAPQALEQVLHNLSLEYREILVILLSRHLHPAFDYAVKTLESIRPSATVHMIDSQTTAIGLGALVQAAAGASQGNMPALEIKRYLLGLIPNIYAIFCLRDLTYLQKTGQLELSQAVVADLLQISPLYTLDNGRPIPLYKARSARNLVDIFYEFITEIDHLKQVALLQGYPPFTSEARSLHERLQAELHGPNCIEMSLNPVLAAILGPHTLAAFGIADPG